MTRPDTKRPAMPWYPKDFNDDEAVRLMSLEAEAVYRRLLDHQWMEGSIPAGLSAIAAIAKHTPLAKMRRLWPQMADKFAPAEGYPDRLVNAKVEKVRADQEAFLARQSEAGKQGAKVRWKGHRKRGKGKGKPMATPLPPQSDGNAEAMAERCVAVACKQQLQSGVPSGRAPHDAGAALPADAGAARPDVIPLHPTGTARPIGDATAALAHRLTGDRPA